MGIYDVGVQGVPLSANKLALSRRVASYDRDDGLAVEKEDFMNEPEETPADVPMNRAERRHLAKNAGSADKLHDFRAQQAQRTSPVNGVGHGTMQKRGAVHRKTGS